MTYKGLFTQIPRWNILDPRALFPSDRADGEPSPRVKVRSPGNKDARWNRGT